MIKSLMNSRAGLQLVKASPEIMLYGGVAGVFIGTLMACKATLAADEVIDRAKDKLDRIKNANELIEDEDYTPALYKRDLAVTYAQTAFDFAVLYGPSIAVIGLSIGSIVGSHRIMKGRNLALMAAYKVVEEGFASYRRRVKEEHGERVDFMYKHGLREEPYTEIEVDEETGKTKKVKKTTLVDVADTNDLSVYARFYDDGCTQWTKTPEYNFMFLRAQQNYFNDMLKARGHVFLNEVYDALGIPRSQAGAVVGWVLGQGDDFVDFGIFDSERPGSRNLVNGYERAILLDFNVDGVIYDLI
jgi:hypothetical protein